MWHIPRQLERGCTGFPKNTYDKITFNWGAVQIKDQNVFMYFITSGASFTKLFMTELIHKT